MKRSWFVFTLVSILNLLGWANELATADFVYIAGRDFTLAERDASGNNPVSENNFVNQAVPQWSYGSRPRTVGVASTEFQGLTAHVNNPTLTLDGFEIAPGDGAVVVNYADTPQPHFSGAVASRELLLHPQSGNVNLGIVRFTMPTTGLTSINAYWRDLNVFGGDGARGHIVLNGTILDTQNWNDATQRNVSLNNLSLNAGDLLDFVIDAGPSNDFTFDSTAFDATISIVAVPEPNTFILSTLCCAGIALRRKRLGQGA